MKRLFSAPEYGVLFIEDADSGELSIQCLCGGMASWWRRVVLTEAEADAVRSGTFDYKRMMVEICRSWHTITNRVVEPIELTEIAGLPDA